MEALVKRATQHLSLTCARHGARAKSAIAPFMMNPPFYSQISTPDHPQH